MFYAAVLPFTDPTTDLGFYINFVHQIVTLTIAFPGLFGIELVFCIVRNAIAVNAALITDSIQTLDENLRRDPTFSIERAWELRNLIVKVQDFDA